MAKGSHTIYSSTGHMTPTRVQRCAAWMVKPQAPNGKIHPRVGGWESARASSSVIRILSHTRSANFRTPRIFLARLILPFLFGGALRALSARLTILARKLAQSSSHLTNLPDQPVGLTAAKLLACLGPLPLALSLAWRYPGWIPCALNGAAMHFAATTARANPSRQVSRSHF